MGFEKLMTVNRFAGEIEVFCAQPGGLWSSDHASFGFLSLDEVDLVFGGAACNPCGTAVALPSRRCAIKMRCLGERIVTTTSTDVLWKLFSAATGRSPHVDLADCRCPRSTRQESLFAIWSSPKTPRDVDLASLANVA